MHTFFALREKSQKWNHLFSKEGLFIFPHHLFLQCATCSLSLSFDAVAKVHREEDELSIEFTPCRLPHQIQGLFIHRLSRYSDRELPVSLEERILYLRLNALEKPSDFIQELTSRIGSSKKRPPLPECTVSYNIAKKQIYFHKDLQFPQFCPFGDGCCTKHITITTSDGNDSITMPVSEHGLRLFAIKKHAQQLIPYLSLGLCLILSYVASRTQSWILLYASLTSFSLIPFVFGLTKPSVVLSRKNAQTLCLECHADDYFRALIELNTKTNESSF